MLRKPLFTSMSGHQNSSDFCSVRRPLPEARRGSFALSERSLGSCRNTPVKGTTTGTFQLKATRSSLGQDRVREAQQRLLRLTSVVVGTGAAHDKRLRAYITTNQPQALGFASHTLTHASHLARQVAETLSTGDAAIASPVFQQPRAEPQTSASRGARATHRDTFHAYMASRLCFLRSCVPCAKLHLSTAQTAASVGVTNRREALGRTDNTPPKGQRG